MKARVRLDARLVCGQLLKCLTAEVLFGDLKFFLPNVVCFGTDGFDARADLNEFCQIAVLVSVITKALLPFPYPVLKTFSALGQSLLVRQ